MEISPSQPVGVEKARRWPDYLITALFVCLFWVRLAHHQVWRDEVNVWGIAVASRTLPDLFAKIRYEGHPSLWYLLIWIVSKFAHSFLAMKFVQAGIGAAIYIVIGLWSPFSRTHRLLLFCSYFVFFEYTVLSRTYGLTLLVLLIFLVNRFSHQERVIRNVVVLALLANTESIGLVLSVVLFAEYIWDFRRVRIAVPASLLFAAAVAICCWSALPASDVSTRSSGYVLQHIHEPKYFALAALANILLPWLTINATYPKPFWDPGLTYSIGHFVLAAPVLLAYCYSTRRSSRAAFVLFATLACGIAFSFLVYFGSARNFGLLFLAFLFVIWSLSSRRIPLPGAAVVLLSISALQGIAAGAAEYHHPFSNSGAAAHWLQAHRLAHAHLVGTPDTSVAGVAEQLGTTAYFLDCECADTYMSYSARRDRFRKADIPMRLQQAVQKFSNERTVLVLTEPFDGRTSQSLKELGIELLPIASFTGAEAWQEDFFLYSVNTQSREAPPQRTVGADVHGL